MWVPVLGPMPKFCILFCFYQEGQVDMNLAIRDSASSNCKGLHLDGIASPTRISIDGIWTVTVGKIPPNAFSVG